MKEFIVITLSCVAIVIGALALAYWLVGQAPKTPARTEPLEATTSATTPIAVIPIVVTPSPEAPPEFERKYAVSVGAHLKGGPFAVVITCWTTRSASLGRLTRGDLTQASGSRIDFDPKRVADRIIDRDLYPIVQAAVDDILANDAAFVASNPAEYTDSNGATWRRVH
jgi:hypothetical protein